MNITKAQEIVMRVAKLAMLASEFQAMHGCNYRLSDASPSSAWELYQQFMTEQASIAALLDEEAVENPFTRYERWWERRDVMNSAMIGEIGAETIRLVEQAAYLTVKEAHQHTYNLRVIQQAIAGMLHPATRRRTLDNGKQETQ